jgi:hypothetical protein
MSAWSGVVLKVIIELLPPLDGQERNQPQQIGVVVNRAVNFNLV